MRLRLLSILAAGLTLLEWAHASEWVRAGVTTNQPLWGLCGGLQWAICPGGFGGGSGGPRGLIRMGSPTFTNGGYSLINFIAIEPIVAGRKGFSELEWSKLDGVQGKRIWPVPPESRGTSWSPPRESGDPEAGLKANLQPGVLGTCPHGAEELVVLLAVEPFENGTSVRLAVSQCADRPDEVRFQVRAAPGTPVPDYCILTATMGNLARARQLWLKDMMVSSLELYPDYKGTGFADHTLYPLGRLWRTSGDDVLVAITTDEREPASVVPFPGTGHWRYRGCPVTQYWMKPAGTWRTDLHATVNARYTYWQSRQPIPGGVAFENFELRERFYQGQQSTFGITRRTPAQLGIRASASGGR